MSLPKPYYQDNAVTLYHGDCREIISNLKSVSATLTDPPYGINGGKGGDSKKYAKGKYSAGFEDTPEYIESVCVPIVKRCIEISQAVAVTPGIRCLELYPKPADMGCFWTPASCTHGPWGMTTFQPILYYGKDYRAGLGPLPTGRTVTEISPKNGHPCPKPLKAWTWLLDKVCPVGGTVLDPFGGSGTTALAAKNTGRNCIIIEMFEEYCEIIATGLAQEVLPI